jgi:hypothetical protein
MLWDQKNGFAPFVPGGERARKNTALRRTPWEMLIAPIIPEIWLSKIMILTRLNGCIKHSSNADGDANFLFFCAAGDVTCGRNP